VRARTTPSTSLGYDSGMKPFAVKLRSGQHVLGLGLSTADLMKMKLETPAVVDLGSIGVGLWFKEADGTRTFLQPRESNLLVMLGDLPEDIGAVLQVDLSSLHKT
jgi:hypothetical protein